MMYSIHRYGIQFNNRSDYLNIVVKYYICWFGNIIALRGEFVYAQFVRSYYIQYIYT